MDQSPHRYRLEVASPIPLQWLGSQEVTLAAGQVLELPLRLKADPADLNAPNV